MPDARPTVAAVLAEARRRLRAAGIEDADSSARRLVAATFGIAEQRLGFAAEAIDEAARRTLDARLARRIAGEPVGRILGVRGFWRHDFALGPDVLEPRPDTETVVEAALAALAEMGRQRPRIADIGTGSGAILVSLLAERPDALGLGIDIAPGAVAVARRNAQAAGVGDRALFAVADFAAALAPGFDLVVSNPPYIPTADLAGLPAEVRHDPRRALDGGPDGLDPYRAVCAQARRVLAPGGRLVLEIGDGAAGGVSAVAGAAGLGLATARTDLGGHVRAMVFG